MHTHIITNKLKTAAFKKTLALYTTDSQVTFQKPIQGKECTQLVFNKWKL